MCRTPGSSGSKGSRYAARGEREGAGAAAVEGASHGEDPGRPVRREFDRCLERFGAGVGEEDPGPGAPGETPAVARRARIWARVVKKLEMWIWLATRFETAATNSGMVVAQRTDSDSPSRSR